MIINDREFYSKPYYFFLKEYKDKYSLYFSVENTLSEARKKDNLIQFNKDKEKEVKSYIKNLIKKQDKKTTDEVAGELEELVNADGGLPNSKIPILDPRLHPKKTTDQTVAAARITNDPITRGYRTYFGEGEISEEDMSDAFGYEETKDLDGKETFKYFVKELDMDPDDAKERTKQQGKDPSGKRDAKSKYKNDKNFISRQIIPELQKRKAIKVLEDLLLKDKQKNIEISEKEKNQIDLIKKNVNSLKKQAEKNGIKITDLLKMFKGE